MCCQKHSFDYTPHSNEITVYYLMSRLSNLRSCKTVQKMPNSLRKTHGSILLLHRTLVISKVAGRVANSLDADPASGLGLNRLPCLYVTVVRINLVI